MVKFFQTIGSLVYSIIFSYLLWLGFHYAIPLLMAIHSFAFILALILFGGLIYGVILIIPDLLFVPLNMMCINNDVAKIFATIPLLIFGFCSCLDPWHLKMEYHTINYIYAFLVTVFIVFYVYFGFIRAIWIEKDY